MPLLDQIHFLAPELVLALGGMAALVAGLFAPSMRMMTVLCATVLLVSMIGLYAQGLLPENTLFGGQLQITLLSQGLKFLLCAATIMVLAMNVRRFAVHGLEKFEFPVLMVFATLGMMIMISASSWLSLYLGLELQSLSFYVMAAFAREDTRASEAGAKYFILGALASGFLLFGMSYIYGATGSLSYMAPVANAAGYGVGMAFILAGIAFKLGLVPFHMWTPDVYDGAPLPVTSYFALVPGIAGVAILVALLQGPFAALASQSGPILVSLGLLSIALGAFAGLRQNNLKRLLAYSAIANIGTLILALSVHSNFGVLAAFNYLFIYIAMSGVIFAAILGLRLNDEPVEKLDDLAGLSKSYPLLAWSMAIALFALAGIPPLAGFFAKFDVFRAVVLSGNVPVAALGIALNVVAAAYYLRIIKIMFFDAAKPGDVLFHDGCLARRAVIVLMLAIILLLVFQPDAIIDFIAVLLPTS